MYHFRSWTGVCQCGQAQKTTGRPIRPERSSGTVLVEKRKENVIPSIYQTHLRTHKYDTHIDVFYTRIVKNVHTLRTKRV